MPTALADPTNSVFVDKLVAVPTFLAPLAADRAGAEPLACTVLPTDVGRIWCLGQGRAVVVTAVFLDDDDTVADVDAEGVDSRLVRASAAARLLLRSAGADIVVRVVEPRMN